MVDPHTSANLMEEAECGKGALRGRQKAEWLQEESTEIHIYLLEANSGSQRKRPQIRLTVLGSTNITLDQEGVFTKRDLS